MASKTTTLSVQSHTNVMQALMDNVDALREQMPRKRKAPSQTEALQMLLKVEGLGAKARADITEALRILPQLERAKKKIPAATQKALADVRKQLARCETNAERVKLLRDLQRSGKYDVHPGLATGIDLARKTLEDGARSIYSPSHRFYKLLASGPAATGRALRRPTAGGDTRSLGTHPLPPTTTASQIGAADADGVITGGTTGAVGGAIVGGQALEGAVIGGVAGGLGGSALQGIKELAKWLWG